MRVPFDTMVSVFIDKLVAYGTEPETAREAAVILAQNSADGVYSHGVNRFPRLINYIQKGYIHPNAVAKKIDGIGSLERWDGQLGLGMVNAKNAMTRACELAKTHGVGVVAIKNTNHWMRGGTYGWQAADAGSIGICWTNTQPNMPAWGAKDRRIGNNPFIIAVPRGNGEHVVLDCAMSQFSYGKIELTKLQGKQLPVPGGFGEDGNATTDPAAIEKTWRVLPIGYWKGSGMSIALDLVAAILSGGYSVTDVGKNSEDEYGLSQVLIALDPSAMNEPGFADDLIERLVDDIASSEPAKEGCKVRYPGENSLATRKENMELGIPVIDDVWNTINSL